MNIKQMKHLKHAINLMQFVGMYPEETPYTSQSWIRCKGICRFYLPKSIAEVRLENLGSAGDWCFEANLGGYIAISDLFKKAGGYLNESREPVFRSLKGIRAIANWLDMDDKDAVILLNVKSIKSKYSLYHIEVRAGFPQKIVKYNIRPDLITANMVRSALMYYLKNNDFNGFKVSHILATRAGFLI